MTLAVLEVRLESDRKWLAEMVGKLDKNLVEQIEFLGPFGPEFPRALPTELKGIAV